MVQASVRLAFKTGLHEKQGQPRLIHLVGTKDKLLFPKEIYHSLLQKFV